MSDPAVRRRYSIIVGLEFGLLGAGAALLGLTGQDQWVPVWICFGVGAHFFPLASALDNPSLRPLGLLLAAVAIAALITGLASTVAPSTITGLGAGLCLLAFGLATLFTGGAGHSGSRPIPWARSGGLALRARRCAKVEPGLQAAAVSVLACGFHFERRAWLCIRHAITPDRRAG